MSAPVQQAPFDVARLDRCLGERGIDLLIATSKHSVQYLLGGYRFFFYGEGGDNAISRTSYVSAVGYLPGSVDATFYVGNTLERDQQFFEPLWVPEVIDDAWSGADVAARCADQIVALGLDRATVAVEMPFLPAQVYVRLVELLPRVTFVDAVPALEEMRAVKTVAELDRLRRVSELVCESMLATFAIVEPGMTTAAIADAMRVEEVSRGLRFHYCLTTTGTDHRRAPSARPVESGATLSLDSGGSLDGYLGDIARMAVLGEPTPLQRELLDEVRAIQEAARDVLRPGATGQEVYAAGEAAKMVSPHGPLTSFVAHGMGLVPHEQPHLVDDVRHGADRTHWEAPLEAGMVVSVETTLKHPTVGFVKLEDTVAITPEGSEGLGDGARDYTVAGA
jgi:Xaa-Pro dipeptidase